MRQKRSDPQAIWEQHLSAGLDHLSDLGAEAPPDLASLQMLVVEVQAAQRRALYTDLAKFWSVAPVLLGVMVYSLLEAPLYFLLIQSVLGVLLLIGAGVYQARGRRVGHE